MLELGIKITLGYWLGSLLGSLVMGWFRGGVDIRQLGSGNAGGTNALRTQGKLFALGVMLIDVGKGVAAVMLIPALPLPLIGSDPMVDPEVVKYAVAFAVIVGHVYPIWFEFRGGKGGATAAGLLFVLAPALAPWVIGFWIALVYFTGYVGLATMSATAAAAVLFLVMRWSEDPLLGIFGIAVAVLVVYTHRSNIMRMRAGTEARFSRRSGGFSEP